MAETLYGRNAVRETLRARRRHIHHILLADGLKTGGIIREIIDLARQQQVPVKKVPRKSLNAYGSAHQGVSASVGRLPSLHLTDLQEHTNKRGGLPFFLALDHLEDPHNVGALLRTAEAVGVDGVILPTKRAVGITPTVVNASAGASEHLPIVLVANLAQTLNRLKEDGHWIIGADMAAKAQPYHTATLDMPLTLVLGSEGKGLSSLVAKTCDLLLALPMRGHIESLNASVAGALLLYEVWRKRQFAFQ